MASNDVDLLFSKPQPDGGMPVELVFGDDDTGPEIPVVLVQAAGRITGLRLPLLVRPGVRAQAGGRITGLRQSIGARYDVNTARPLVSLTQAAFQAAQPVAAGATSRHSGAHTERAGALTRWQAAGQQSSLVRTAWQATKQLQRGVATAWQQGRQLHVDQVQLRWQTAQAVSAAAAARYQQGLDLAADQVLSRHQDAWRDRFAAVATRHQDAANHLGVAAGQPLGNAAQLVLLTHARHQDAWMPRIGTSRPPTPPGPQPCYVPALPVELLFDQMADAGQPVHLVFVCDGRTAPPGAAVVVPIRRVYLVINSVTLHRVDTGAELQAHGFSLSLDYQSWTWTWNASLHHDAAAHLGRDSQGDPAELEAMVNGLPFRLRLERIGRDRRFNPTRWAVGGKGKAAILGAPWAPAMSFANATTRTAQQLMGDVLTINGVPLGWGLDWGLTDWSVPAGAWAFRGSYIDAVNDIATAAGGYVQPHPTDAVLRVLPRYPVAPWDWDTVTPDFEIPDFAAEVEGTEYVDKPLYNRVFVGGVGAGVSGPFTRSGSAGDVIAPQVNHALITDLPAFRQRGLAEISDTGRQEHVTLTMQVLPATGIIMPGQFIRYVGEKTVMGLVRSTGINFNRPTLRQVIGIETHA